jgi:hypothetical protein
MNQRSFIALLTVLMFGAGYAVRMLTDESNLHVPAPPAALVRELASASSPQPQAGKEIDRTKLSKNIADIEKYRQQIEAYRAQVDEIYSEFDREFVQILNPAQKEKYLANQAANQKRMAEMEAKHKSSARPLTDDDISRARNQPMTDVYWMVTVTPRLEGLSKDYNLDASQQASLRSLLNIRRNKFISLLDSTPHPSVRLSRLAPMIKQIEELAKPAAAK